MQGDRVRGIVHPPDRSKRTEAVLCAVAGILAAGGFDTVFQGGSHPRREVLLILRRQGGHRKIRGGDEGGGEDQRERDRRVGCSLGAAAWMNAPT
jgi:hypothetical protein